MRVGTKLAGGYAVLIGLMGLLLLGHLATIHQIASSNRRVSEIISRLSLASSAGLRLIDEMQESADKYVVLHDEGYARSYALARAAYDSTVQRLRSLPVAGREREAVDRLTVEWRAFRERAPGVAELATGPPALRDSLAEALRRLQARTSDVQGASEEAILAHLERSSAATREAGRATRIALILSVVVALVVSTIVVRSISDSLNRLHKATHAVARGDFSVRLDAAREDEFAELARDFNVMTRRLGEVDEAKRDFFSSVSHNLKSPLASMQETGRLLLERIPGDLNAKQERLLHLSLESGERLARMISNLLDLSTMEAGAMDYRLEEVDLARLARGIGERFRARLADREVAVDVRAPERLVVPCDGHRVEQLVENLLENAIRFSPPGGRIEIELRRCDEPPAGAADRVRAEASDAGWAALSVRDAGPGVAEEHRERIFERFHQVRTSERRPGAGVGLGLAICREIAAAHRGAIWVEPAPGGGSEFTLLLPIGDGARSRGSRPAEGGREDAGEEGWAAGATPVPAPRRIAASSLPESAPDA